MHSGDSIVLLLFVGYFVLLPAMVYLYKEQEHRLRWHRRTIVRVPEGVPGGAFRDDGHAPVRDYVSEHHGAPREVKVTIVTSLVLGLMFLPGLAAGLFGLVMYGLGLVSIPGLLLAGRIFVNAFGLLRCEPKAAVEARKLGEFARYLNYVVLAVVGLLVLVGLPIPLAIFTAAYAGISLLHAEGLDMAADAIDAVHRGDVEGVVVRDAAPAEAARGHARPC